MVLLLTREQPDEQDVTYKRAALRLVRNLSLNKRCRKRMYELKLITQIYSLMTELSVAKEFEQFEIDDVIEACLSAIHILCKDLNHRKLLMNNDPSGVVKTLVQLALAPSLNCKREALGALAELSQVGCLTDKFAFNVLGFWIPKLDQEL